MKKILFEITTSHGTSLVNSIRHFPDDVSDERIQTEFEKWRDSELANLESGWSVWNGR
jgi:hypothetical protein